ncbi:MAG: tetratricopeptide repeat protein [Bacteroidales bacterium]
MNSKRLLLIAGFILLCLSPAFSQVSFSGEQLNSRFNRGMELFSKEKYPAAIRLFDSYLEDNTENDMILRSDAEYFAAISSLMVFNPDAEYRMIKYIQTNPGSPRINEARLSLADYFYQNRNYRRAAFYYETVNRQELTGEKLAEYFFRHGYSLYATGDRPRALLMFSEIKDIDTEYTAPAVYYFSHIAYEQNNYQTALDGFTRLRYDETFGSVVPFYIAQILYLNKDYEGILAIAPDLLESSPKERTVELYRFIGDAYYNKEMFREAIPYLESYAAGAKASAREDKYQLGFCYYKTDQIDKAIKILLEAGARNDILSQNIWFLLGDCYLKTDDKKRAQFAFGEASKMDYDQKLKEESLFNYARLTYETSYSPFGEAINAFQQYIDLYPGSDKIEEAYNYLVATFMEVRNYRSALAALDKIRVKNERLEEAYQKVAFFRGLELFRNMELEASIAHFDKSLEFQKYSRDIRARSLYWRGEARYRSSRFDLARDDYEAFMGIPGSGSLSENNLVRYNLGYAYFNMGDYTNALTHFRNFEGGTTRAGADVITDTRCRIADCYYITTRYPDAIAYYDKVIDYGKTDADYAMFQKAFSLGLMNNNRGKTDVLTSLVSRFPGSAYVPNAVFERGRAYVVMEDFKRGEADFNTVISDYPASPFVPRAIVQLGLLYYNQGDNQRAVAQFKKVIENFQSTPEARSAMTGLRNAYVDLNDVESYFTYVKSLGGYGDVNLAEKDSLLYASGENLYMAGRCDRATEVFRNYLSEFRNGSFRINAQFYLAECLYSSGNANEALKLYQEIITVPNTQFLEQSLITAASILYDREEYLPASSLYERLESISANPANRLTALKGQLRSAYQAGDAQTTIRTANKITQAGNVPDELNREALFMRAKARYSLNEFEEALTDFRKVATEVTTTEGAESKYRVAELLYKRGTVSESERVITEFIDQNTPHQYWMARIFLLLADISISKGDTLQARATLQSLNEYYTTDNDGIRDEVRAKLALLDGAN